MYILDAYHGLFLLDLQRAAATHLVSPHTAIDTLSDAASQLPPMFFNDLDLWGDEVVFSDSSYKFTRSENRRCLNMHVCMNECKCMRSIPTHDVLVFRCMNIVALVELVISCRLTSLKCKHA